jgi:hypothetical protein
VLKLSEIFFYIEIFLFLQLAVTTRAIKCFASSFLVVPQPPNSPLHSFQEWCYHFLMLLKQLVLLILIGLMVAVLISVVNSCHILNPEALTFNLPLAFMSLIKQQQLPISRTAYFRYSGVGWEKSYFFSNNSNGSIMQRVNAWWIQR